METVSIQHSTLTQHSDGRLRRGNLSKYHEKGLILKHKSTASPVQRAEIVLYQSVFVSTVKYIWAIFQHKTSVNLTPPNWTHFIRKDFSLNQFHTQALIPLVCPALALWSRSIRRKKKLFLVLKGYGTFM